MTIRVRLLAAALTGTLYALTPNVSQAQWPDVREAKAIAEEGFIYGLPIVMNYAVMNEYAVNKNSGQFKAPFNQINNQARVYTYKDTAVITPNSDTPYSIAWLDLRAEPVVLSVPAVDKARYYSVMLEDGNTFVYGYIGSRATGNEAGDYMVVGPGWNGATPSGIKKVFRSTTQFSAVAYRTQLFGPDDIGNVKKVQAGYKVQPLSAYLKQPAPPAAAKVDFPKIDKEMVKKNFFEYLDFSLQFAPAGPEEKEIRAKLARIGVGAGKTSNFKDLPLTHKLEIALGMKDGEAKVENTSRRTSKPSTDGRFLHTSATARFQRQLVASGRRCQGRDLRQYSGRGGLSPYEDSRQWREARRQQAQLHADIPCRTIPAGECVLVRDDVRRQDAVADQESDQSIPDQLANALRHEEECGWFIDAIHPKQISGR